jgi:hypothetical protein
VAGPDAVLAHQPLDPFLAGREAAATQLPDLRISVMVTNRFG